MAVLFPIAVSILACLYQCLTPGPMGIFLPGSSGSQQNRRLHPPLLIEPLMVTGTVGEFRNGNFHYGLDFSTGGEVGANVHAVDDGFVRRVMFGRYNIGYAIWIEHPDGRVSRYGHLQSFSHRLLAHPSVASIHEKILLRKNFVLHIPDESLPVRRGEVIASSGETGIGFAHLHFEYIERDKHTWLNPLRFGLQLPDRRPPIFQEVTIVPADANSRLNGKSDALRIALIPAGPPVWNPATETLRFEQTYVPAKPLRPDELRVFGAVRFQLDAYDAAEPNGRSRLGLAAGRLFRADRPNHSLFAFHFDRLPRLPGFHHGTLFDRFHTKLRGGARYLYNYSERAPGALPFVTADKDQGRVSFHHDRKQNQSITLSGTDATGNLASVTLELQGASRRKVTTNTSDPDDTSNANESRIPPTVFADRSATLQTANGSAELFFEAGQTFEDLALRLRPAKRPGRLPRGMQLLSPAYAFERVIASDTGAPRVAAYIDFFGKIKGKVIGTPPAKSGARPVQIGVYRLGRRHSVTPISLPTPMIPGKKATGAGDDRNQATAQMHTLFADGRYHFRTRSTGVFVVLADRAPPEFRPVPVYAPGRLRKRPHKHRKFRGDLYQQADMRIFLRPRDVGAGVDYNSLEVTVDGIQCFTDHDPDRKHAEVFWPAHITQPGDHILIANIRDRAGNSAKTFRYNYRVIK